MNNPRAPIVIADPEERRSRRWLAFGLTGFAVLNVAILSIVIIVADAKSEKAQLVLSAVLPLIGTWVGTVLAFYFSKDNFESSAQYALEFAQSVTPQQQLRSTSVASAMVPLSRLYYKTDKAESLKAILVELDARDLKRLPILDSAGLPVALVYKEDILDFLFRSTPGYTVTEQNEKSLGDLLITKVNSPRPFALIAETGNLADAKEAMDLIVGCRDVFVTKSGKKDDKVVGLLTNVDISKYSVV